MNGLFGSVNAKVGRDSILCDVEEGVEIEAQEGKWLAMEYLLLFWSCKYLRAVVLTFWHMSLCAPKIGHHFTKLVPSS